MDIMAVNGKFLIGMLHDFQYKWNKGNTLSVRSKGSGCVLNITTNRGDFVEVVDESGSVINSGGDGEWFNIRLTKKPVNLRFKELTKVNLSKSDMEKHRRVVTRYLVSGMPYDLNIPDTFQGTIEWMQKQLIAIPQASRAEAVFRFATTMEYGETYPNIEITYSELETNKEIAARLQIETERARITENVERAKFRELKSKFCAT